MARENDMKNDMNLDPITKAPGSHPVGTGIGAAVGGVAAGAAAGAVAGPVGAVAGAIVGAVVGGLGGKAVAEAVDPTAEEAYWRENYSDEPYYEQGRTFDDYGPAYRLGVSGRTAYTGSYEESENRLAEDWDRAKESSTLNWPQASAATRAAWSRIDERIGPLDVDADASESANDDVIDTLNDLLETCRDGEYGFRESAEQADSVDIQNLLSRHAEECRSAGLELLTLIGQLGGEPNEGGTASGAMHRGWVSVRSALSAYDDKAVLDECERGEDVAVARYRKALKQDLPAGIRDVVERQAAGARRNHDQIKALRDSLST